MYSLRRLLLLSVLAFGLNLTASVDSDAKLFRPNAERRVIRRKHILHRPNRPLHVYGNTVRTFHHMRRGRRAAWWQ